MFLTFDIKPWYRNVSKRLVKAAKGYLIDTNMVCHLLDYDIDDIAANRPDLFGHLVENFVATELLKQLSYSNIKAELYHFRTSDGKEVDFVIERPDGSVFGIEVKSSEWVIRGDFKGMMTLQELTGRTLREEWSYMQEKRLSPKETISGRFHYLCFGRGYWAMRVHCWL